MSLLIPKESFGMAFYKISSEMNAAIGSSNFFTFEQLEEAEVLSTRQICAIVGASSLLFGGVAIWMNAANYYAFLSIALGIFCLISGLKATPRNSYLINRAICIVCVSILVEISLFNPSMSIIFMYAPLLLHIVYVERNRSWRTLLVLALASSFFWILAQVGVGYDVGLFMPGNQDSLVSVYAVLSGLVGVMLISVNRDRNLYIVETSNACSSKLIEKVKKIEETNAAHKDLFLRLKNTKREIKELIERDRLIQEKLNASREQLNQFAYAAGHDLKEPIRTIRSFMELVKKRISPELYLDPTLNEHFGFISTSSVSMHLLLEKLLIYQRICQGNEQAETFSIAYLWHKAINAALEKMILQRKDAVPAEGLCLESLQELSKKYYTPVSQKDASMGFVKMPLSHAKVIFEELAQNALIYHNSDRPAVISCKVRPMDNGRIELIVSDNGIGIEKQYLDSVFEMFKRLHPREVYPGSGLGLSLVKRIVHKHKGKVWIVSKPDEGTAVHLELPLG